jgi:hypothetical protein
MLTKTELREMRELVTRVQRGSVDRSDWAALAALTLIFQGDIAVAAIASAGYDVFKDTVLPVYEGHGFHDSDYQRIYARVCVAASRPAAAPVAH